MTSLQTSLSEFNKDISPEHWKASIQFDLPEVPIFEKGLELLSQKGDLLLAICLNNGYYNKENIYRMLRFAVAFSDRIQIFFTDGPAQHNYRAMGESEKEIVRKCRLHRNRLRNHCLAALEKMRLVGITPEVALLEWEKIYSDPAYQKSYHDLKELYRASADFQNDINATTRTVLEHRMGLKEIQADKVAIAIEYVLEELAFILSYPSLGSDTKPIVDHGANSFNYMYYEHWSVFENLVNGRYDNRVRGEIGFSIVKI
jgi:tRNA-dependent cyclodipeptide synthase